MSTINKYALMGGAALLVGATLYFLSQDGEVIKFNSSVHSKELLRLIVKDLFVQGATAYSQKLVMLKNLKKSGEMDHNTVESFKHKHQAEMDEIEQEVYADNKVNETIVQEMLKTYAGDSEVKRLLDELSSIE